MLYFIVSLSAVFAVLLNLVALTDRTGCCEGVGLDVGHCYTNIALKAGCDVCPVHLGHMSQFSEG